MYYRIVICEIINYRKKEIFVVDFDLLCACIVYKKLFKFNVK